MKLQDIFDQLSYGEFSQLCIGGQEPGVISEENYARVLAHVGLGLTAIYTHFNLKQGQLTLELQQGKTKYELHSAFAVNGRRSAEAVRYILDAADDPFLDDIIKVEKVLTEGGESFSLNDAADPYSVTTPSSTVLRVPSGLVAGENSLEMFPEKLKTETLSLIYRANHPKISIGTGFFNPARVEIELPDTHLQALLYYVASRVNNPVGMVNEFNAGNNYYTKYLAACEELENKGIQVDQGESNTRLRRGGWC